MTQLSLHNEQIKLDALIDKGLDRQKAGDLVTAEKLFRSALSLKPDSADANHFLGLVYYSSGKVAEAEKFLSRAFEIFPKSPDITANFALFLASKGDVTGSIAVFKKAIQLRPNDPQLFNDLGVQLRSHGMLEEAEKYFRLAIKFGKGHFNPWYNLGNLLLSKGEFCGALEAYKKAMSICPNNPDVAVNLGIVLVHLGSYKEAQSLLENTLRNIPGHAGLLNNLGILHRRRGELIKAQECLEKALGISPNQPDVLYNLGQTLCANNNIVSGRKHLRLAVDSNPHFTKAFWGLHLTLPLIYNCEDQIIEERERWKAGLGEVVGNIRLNTQAEIQNALETISELTNFLLPYQGREDLEIQKIYGNLISRIATAAFPQHTPSANLKPPKRQKPIVVFASSHFRRHTVFNLFSAWIMELPKAEFEVHALSIGQHNKKEVNKLKAAGVVVHTDCITLKSQIMRLSKLEPDVLIYTDIGMDPLTQVLAGLRFAPLQCAAWGHPVTSGMPGIDSFLSSELMEPPKGDNLYSEALVRLPGLSINFERPDVQVEKISAHGAPVFFCSQSLFKISPVQDRFFAELLADFSKAKLRFIEHDNVHITRAFVSRLTSVFKKYQVSFADRVEMCPRTSRRGFFELHSDTTLVLDSFRWSGGNTNLEALALGVPVVTLPGSLMRGRHALGMLTALDLPDLVANSGDNWVEIAIALAKDHSWRTNIRWQIVQRSQKLFGCNLWFDDLRAHLRAQTN